METKTLYTYHISYWVNDIQYWIHESFFNLAELFDYLMYNLEDNAVAPFEITVDPEPFEYRT